MTLIQFLISYSMLIVIASLVICGFYVCTRGEWYIMPDGEMKKYGMIFKEWSLFWEHPSGERKVFYLGDELINKMDLLKKGFPEVRAKITSIDKETGRIFADFTAKDLMSIKDLLACGIEGVSKGPWNLYIYEPIYRFPAWIRKPVSECPACMASVYGSAFYWFVVTLSKSQNIFIWSSSPFWTKIGFWVFFCLILACVNKYISQKMKL